MEPIGYGLQLAGEAEVDREMDACYREQAEEAAVERAKFNAKPAPPERIPADSMGEYDKTLPPEWRTVRERLLAAMKPKKPVEPALVVSMPAKTEEPTLPTVPTDAHEGSVKSEIDATPLPVEITPRSDSGAFPVSDEASVKEYDDPLHAMAELCKHLLMHKDYARVRDDYCHLSLRLNLIGRLAPGWRPQFKAGAAPNDPIHMVIHRDQVVVDLHWCHATNLPLRPKEPSHAALFNGDTDFHFDLAWAITGEKWRKTYRAGEALCLTKFQQCQMLKLHDPEFAARLKNIGAGWGASGGKSVSKIANVKRLISQWAEKDKRILPQCDAYEKLWLAREILEPGASKQQIAELHALMVGGEVEDRTSIRDKLKSLDKHVSTV